MKHNLQLEGVAISLEEEGILTIALDKQRLCQITDSGRVRYWKDDVSDEVRSTALDRITNIAKTTAEYMRLMETASCLSASSLKEDYKVLAEFNDIVLAGHSTKYGAQFITWELAPDRTGLNQGHYYGPGAGINSYAAAKQDFATRSELIPRSALFTQECQRQ